MKRRILSLFLCLLLVLSAAPLSAGAAAEFAVLEIPVIKTVRAPGQEPGSTEFTMELDLAGCPPDTQFSVTENRVQTSGTGDFTGILRVSVPTETDFWNLSEGFVIREKNTGLDGWTYDDTEWLAAPYLHENAPGVIPEKEVRIAFYNLTAGETPDLSHFTGAHSEIRFTNTYNVEAETVQFDIPYTKTVSSADGSVPPARPFALTLGEVPPTVLENCAVSGNVIETRGAGSYSGVLSVRPQNGDALAGLMNGFTVREEHDGDSLWDFDRSEWFVVPELNGRGGYRFTIYDLTAGDEPYVSAGRDELAFANVYLGTEEPAPSAPPVAVGGPVHVTYDPNGGRVENPVETVEPGTEFPLTKTANRDGWSFLGWFETPDSDRRLTSLRPTTDVTVYAHWRQTPVPDMLNGGEHIAYVVGYEDGTVRPMNQITRAEVTMIFYRLLKEEVRQANHTQENTFEDVNAGDWFNEAVSTMAKIGIIKGRGDTAFDPNAPITRAEYAAICARFDRTEAPELTELTDIAGHWAEKEIRHAVAIGWVRGYADGTFRPNQPITRAESMTLTNRVLQRLPAAASDMLPGMRTFSDNADATAWYYLVIQESTNAHTYDRKPDGGETWTSLI